MFTHYVESEARCELLGPFAIFVQASLGALAVLSLFYKRHIERPRRPFKIWFFDVSKQLAGAFVVHFLNIAMSSDNDLGERASPCTWYFLNVLLDTTIGVGLLWTLLRLLSAVCDILDARGVKSGVYGTPPKWSWWAKQSLIYTIGLSIMKISVFAILRVIPQLGELGTLLLKWSETREKARIFFVLFFFPLVMNIIQYIIIDNIVMSHTVIATSADCEGAHEPASNDVENTSRGKVHHISENTSLLGS